MSKTRIPSKGATAPALAVELLVTLAMDLLGILRTRAVVDSGATMVRVAAAEKTPRARPNALLGAIVGEFVYKGKNRYIFSAKGNYIVYNILSLLIEEGIEMYPSCRNVPKPRSEAPRRSELPARMTMSCGVDRRRWGAERSFSFANSTAWYP